MARKQKDYLNKDSVNKAMLFEVIKQDVKYACFTRVLSQPLIETNLTSGISLRSRTLTKIAFEEGKKEEEK
jgi:hypothetical protein